MTSGTVAPETVLAPEREDESQLKALVDRLMRIEERRQTARLVGPDGEEIPLPGSAFHALKRVVDAMSRGQSIALVPQGKELTTKQAADLLHVSRTFLSRSLLGTEIPFEMVGSHRRVKLEDVLAYRERRAKDRRALLEEMAAQAQEVEGGYR